VALRIYATVLDILRPLDAMPFTLADSAISQGPIFQCLHVVLPVFKAAGFPPGQLAGFDASFDALILVFQPPLGARRKLRERVGRESDRSGDEGCDDWFLHDSSLMLNLLG
jgi:hypothetical protein